MQTWLPHRDFAVAASMLDNRRLLAQIGECRQIFSAITGRSTGWKNHPATKQWDGYGNALFAYALAMHLEATSRGLNDEKNFTALTEMAHDFDDAHTNLPQWYNDTKKISRVVYTHQRSLFHKNPEFYADFEHAAGVVDKNLPDWVCCSRCNYYWPTHAEV